MGITEDLLKNEGFNRDRGMDGHNCVTPYYVKEILEKSKIKLDEYKDEIGVIKNYCLGFAVYMRKELSGSWVMTLKMIEKNVFTPNDKHSKHKRAEHSYRTRILQARWISEVDDFNYIVNGYNQFKPFAINVKEDKQ